MTGPDIAPFDPADAAEEELRGCYRTERAAFLADYPHKQFSAFESYAEQLRRPESLYGPRRMWTARVAGRIVGTAIASFPEHENERLTVTNVRVAPEERRRGIGTLLLRATLPETQARGRTTVTGQGLPGGGAGERWAAALGFTTVQAFVLQSLVVTEADRRLWEVPAPEGYRCERWVGEAPEALVSSFARARTAITDAPTGDSSLAFPDWSPERVRAHEADLRTRGYESRVVVAVHEASGAVAALTEMVVRLSRPHVGYQQDTAVLPEFRGHGLGRLIKGTMMRWLVADRPEIELMATNTDVGNAHMIRVNHSIGYVTDNRVSDVEASADALAAPSRRG